MLEDFRVGGVVTLKSGGPLMTIREAKTHKGDYFNLAWWEVTCVWFDSANRLQTSIFSSDELVIEEESQARKRQDLHAVL